RSPSRIVRLMFCRARISIYGLTERRNIRLTMKSFSGMRRFCRTRKTRLTFSSSIDVICSELEDDLLLQMDEHQRGGAGDGGGAEGGQRDPRNLGKFPVQKRGPQQLDERRQRVEMNDPSQFPADFVGGIDDRRRIEQNLQAH